MYGLLFNKASAGDFTLNGQEIDISAIPYFFGTKDKNSDTLSYDWNLNGTAITSNTKKSTVVLRQTPGTPAGIARLMLEVAKQGSIYQFANTVSNIYFSGNAATNSVFPNTN